MTNPYIICAGDFRDELEPMKSAPTEEAAIAEAKRLEYCFPCVEAVYMPEDDPDVNDLIYSHYSDNEEEAD